MRPHRASREISTIGENAQRTPADEASEAATRAAFSTISGSQVAARPSGIGNVVRNPWMTSSPKISGIFKREFSTAILCSAFVSRAPRRISQRKLKKNNNREQEKVAIGPAISAQLKRSDED